MSEQRWRHVRRAGFVLFGIGYLAFFVTQGLPVSRTPVMLSILLPLAIGQLGRPWKRWVWMLLELLVYVAMWFAYDYSRGIADRLGMPLQVETPRNIDRFLFFGTDPNVWMQDRFWSRTTVRWWDVAGSITYYTHFLFPVAIAVVLWVTKRSEWAAYVRRFATVLFVAVVSFVLMPTVPPWIASEPKYKFEALPRLGHTATRGWAHLGLDSFVELVVRGRDWANPYAAMPSLHGGFALLVPLFLWRYVKHPLGRGLLMLHPLAMILSLVYFAEHYVIDVVAGWLLVVASFRFWSWWERRRASASRPVYGPLGRFLRRFLGEPDYPPTALDQSLTPTPPSE